MIWQKVTEWDYYYSILHTAEEKIHELDDTAIETIQNEIKGEKKF